MRSVLNIKQRCILISHPNCIWLKYFVCISLSLTLSLFQVHLYSYGIEFLLTWLIEILLFQGLILCISISLWYICIYHFYFYVKPNIFDQTIKKKNYIDQNKNAKILFVLPHQQYKMKTKKFQHAIHIQTEVIEEELDRIDIFIKW